MNMAEDEETVSVTDEEIKKVEEEIEQKDKERDEEIAKGVRAEMEQEAETKKLKEEKEALEAKLTEKEEQLVKEKEENQKVVDAEVERRVEDGIKQRKAVTTDPEVKDQKPFTGGNCPAGNVMVYRFSLSNCSPFVSPSV